MEDIKVTTTQAASLLNVCSKTIINYCTQNKLEYTKNSISKRYAVNLESIKKLLRETGKTTKENRQK